MIFPETFKKGDTVAIIAPSSPVSSQRIGSCIRAVENLGYRVKIYRPLDECLQNGYSAGTGEERADEMMRAFSDPEVKGVWCLRGGDSSTRVLHKLDLDVIRRNPKPFIGYSDITNFHLLFNQQCQMVTFHGPMVSSNVVDDYDAFTRASFETMLNMGNETALANPEGVPIKALGKGRAKAPIMGGNLTLLCASIGTPYELEVKGKILFMEDVDETIWRLDRLLYHLKYAGKLDDAAGIVFGAMSNCINDYNPAFLWEDLLKDLFADYHKPVIYNIMAGHCTPTATIPLGATCVIDADHPSVLFQRP